MEVIMPKVGVLLSGCGFLDGAEIHESVFTLLELDRRGATIVCCAPDIEVRQVIDHSTKQPSSETRNVLKEAARIARCEITDVAKVRAADLDALVIPGGFGAAKNLCSFADDGAECLVDPGVEKLISGMLEQKKPLGAICIAPALLARVAGQCGIQAKLTIGNDAATAGVLKAMGCVHEPHAVSEVAVDQENKIVSTPAYMLGPGPAAVYEGVGKLIEKLLEMTA
jgi:enhancing lycopene biosynthesis protein 2